MKKYRKKAFKVIAILCTMLIFVMVSYFISTSNSNENYQDQLSSMDSELKEEEEKKQEELKKKEAEEKARKLKEQAKKSNSSKSPTNSNQTNNSSNTSTSPPRVKQTTKKPVVKKPATPKPAPKPKPSTPKWYILGTYESKDQARSVGISKCNSVGKTCEVSLKTSMGQTTVSVKYWCLDN